MKGYGSPFAIENIYAFGNAEPFGSRELMFQTDLRGGLLNNNLTVFRYQFEAFFFDYGLVKCEIFLAERRYYKTTEYGRLYILLHLYVATK